MQRSDPTPAVRGAKSRLSQHRVFSPCGEAQSSTRELRGEVAGGILKTNSGPQVESCHFAMVVTVRGARVTDFRCGFASGDFVQEAAHAVVPPHHVQPPCNTPAAEDKENALTIRQRIRQLLMEGEYTAKDISRILGLKEREVYDHLPHVEKSLGSGASVICEPARCLTCDFVFAKRKRLTNPGRCPVCRSEHISAPVYGIRCRK